MPVLKETDVAGYQRRKGKVRDIYQVGNNWLVIIATDRISAFDVVLPNAIPNKGRVLAGITEFWFKALQAAQPNHLAPARLPEEFQRPEFEGRAMACLKTDPLPVECVVRGFLAGSGWKDYQKTNRVFGHDMPRALKEGSQLPQPLFTPTTKAEGGQHDESVNFERFCELAGGEETGIRLRDWSLEIYQRAAEMLRLRGIILADTKFEFGRRNGEIILIDEILTPDSSRFWPLESYEPGQSQPSLDKQPVRDWLAESGWDRKPPAPELPQKVVQETEERYLQIFRQITGKSLDL